MTFVLLSYFLLFCRRLFRGLICRKHHNATAFSHALDGLTRNHISCSPSTTAATTTATAHCVVRRRHASPTAAATCCHGGTKCRPPSKVHAAAPSAGAAIHDACSGSGRDAPTPSAKLQRGCAASRLSIPWWASCRQWPGLCYRGPATGWPATTTTTTAVTATTAATYPRFTRRRDHAACTSAWCFWHFETFGCCGSPATGNDGTRGVRGGVGCGTGDQPVSECGGSCRPCERSGRTTKTNSTRGSQGKTSKIKSARFIQARVEKFDLKWVLVLKIKGSGRGLADKVFQSIPDFWIMSTKVVLASWTHTQRRCINPLESFSLLCQLAPPACQIERPTTIHLFHMCLQLPKCEIRKVRLSKVGRKPLR